MKKFIPYINSMKIGDSLFEETVLYSRTC